MKIEPIIVSGIHVGDRLRAVDQKRVYELANSMKEIGLLSPITVHTPNERNVHLVAGAHRLAAAIHLGWEEIDSIFIDGDEIFCRLAEIDENLCRSELSPTEVAEHLAKRKELWEARENQVAQAAPPENSTGYKSPPPQSEGFASDTARSTGRDKSTINRAVKRANEVCQEARDLIRGTKMDTGATLDKLVKMEPEEQVEHVRMGLEAIADQARREELRQERQEREREAKEAREAALDECRDFLSKALDARQWRYLIDVVERSGGSLKADSLRKWSVA